jgi:putative ABC transport system permease protein
VGRLRVWAARLKGALLPRAGDERLADELQAHLELLADEYAAKGLSPDDARLAARRAFGGVDQMTARHRDQRGVPLLAEIAQDVRFAARLIAKDRSFAAAAIMALALGIGTSTTVFTILNGMLFRPVPFEKPWQVVGVRGYDASGRLRMPTWQLFKDWQSNAASVAVLAATRDESLNLGDDHRMPDRIAGTFITANGFELLGVQPIVGRGFVPEDDRPGAAPVIVLGHGVWKDRYGADPSFVGRTVRVNGTATTVIGVMPPEFKFPFQSDAWQPMALLPSLATTTGAGPVVTVFGRLHDKVGPVEAGAALTSITAGSQWSGAEAGLREIVVPLKEFYFGNDGYEVPLLMSVAAMFVLLIACANVAILLLARAASRAREVAMRAALGAGRGRIVRQLLVESLVLAAIGSTIGFGLAVVGVRLFTHEISDLTLPYWTRFTFDGQVFAFVAAACIGCTVLFGLAPALHLSRTHVGDVLNDGARTGASGHRARRWTSALLVSELALTVVLLTGAALLVHSAMTLGRADAIINGSGIWAMRLSLPAKTYPAEDQRRRFFRQLEERLDGLTGTSAASLTTALPYSGAMSRLLAMEGEDSAGRRLPPVTVVSIGARYFETLGLGLRAGQTFEAADIAAGQVVIVNERFASQFSANRDPIGRRLALYDELNRDAAPIEATIVGVAPTVRQRPMSEAGPVVFRPFLSSAPAAAAILVRTESGSPLFAGALREIVHDLDPDLPVFGLQSLERISQFSRWMHRVISTLVGTFAIIAIVLSTFGLYAVTSYSVVQRTQEVGVRMALGARGSQVVALLLRTTAVQLVIGLGAGTVVAIGVSRLLGSLLVQARPSNALVIAGISALLAAVSIAAAVIPARRAARVDPVVALRHE